MEERIEGIVYSGKGFYIGDICCALSDAIYRGFWGDEKGFEDGVHTVPGIGLRFAVARTAYGDGCYEDQERFVYGVDAGVMGLVPIELVEKDVEDLGKVVLGGGEASFESEDGIFDIALPDGKHINIDTNYDCYDEYEDEYDE